MEINTDKLAMIQPSIVRTLTFVVLRALGSVILEIKGGRCGGRSKMLHAEQRNLLVAMKEYKQLIET